MTTGPWASVEDIANYLDVGKVSVDRLIEHQNLLAHEIGRLGKFKLGKFDKWVDAGGGDPHHNETRKGCTR